MGEQTAPTVRARSASDEWLVCRRYLSEESMRLILDAVTEPIVSLPNDNDQEEVAALAA